MTGYLFKNNMLKIKIKENIELTIKGIEHVNEAQNGIDKLVQRMAPEGGKKLKEWYLSANNAERNAYFRSFQNLQPFFVFDAHPLYVVYLTSSTGIQVMYFTLDEGGNVLWTNSSHITDIDKLFKNGRFYNASLNKKPFSEFLHK